MTKEELLKPRYKVIADYPSREADGLGVGDIIDVYRFKFVMPEEMDEYFGKYPHLFKKLEWWEERKPEDMPEYVKAHPDWVDPPCSPFYVMKVFKWDKNCDRIQHEKGGGLLASYVVPATKEEYEELNQSPKL